MFCANLKYGSSFHSKWCKNFVLHKAETGKFCFEIIWWLQIWINLTESVRTCAVFSVAFQTRMSCFVALWVIQSWPWGYQWVKNSSTARRSDYVHYSRNDSNLHRHLLHCGFKWVSMCSRLRRICCFGMYKSVHLSWVIIASLLKILVLILVTQNWFPDSSSVRKVMNELRPHSQFLWSVNVKLWPIFAEGNGASNGRASCKFSIGISKTAFRCPSSVWLPLLIMYSWHHLLPCFTVLRP